MTSSPSPWTPEFEGQRPPFSSGNTSALTHGAHSARLVEQRVEARLAALAAEDPAWLAPVDVDGLRGWAWAESTCDLLREYLAEHGPLDEHGKPRPASELLLKWERRAADARASLGLEPLARARLGRDAAVGRAAAEAALQTLKANGRAVIPTRGGEDVDVSAGDPPGGAT